MASFLTREQLHGHLRDQGHGFWSDNPEVAPIRVSPPPEEYVTVALEPDATLKPKHRQCYFVCVRNDDGEPVIYDDAEFALREPFATVAERHPTNNYFMMGPIRWLLRRIERFERILLWPPDGFCGAYGLDFTFTISGVRLQDLPRLANHLNGLHVDPSEVTAIVLSLNELPDCEVFWEIANLVGIDTYDLFVSDLFGREVYFLHHHEKIAVSIPEKRTRQELLDELETLDDVFEDWSGYEHKADEEFR